MAKLRLGDFQHDGTQYVLRFQEKGGKSREIPVRHDLEGYILAYVDAAGIAAEAKDRPLFRSTLRHDEQLTGNAADQKADLRAGQAAAEGCRAAVAAVAAFLPGDGDHRPVERRACRWRMFNTWPGMRSRERPGFTTGGRRR